MPVVRDAPGDEDLRPGRSAGGRAPAPAPLDERPDPLQGLGQVLARVGVRDPDVVRRRSAERRPGEHAHAGLLEQPVGQLGAGQAGPGDVREHVERAGRREASEAGDRVEPVDDEVAPRPELDDHLVDVALRPAERLDRADLGERRRR